MACPTLRCAETVHPVDGCCPQCSECSHEGRSYRSGERFTSISDPCLQCTCKVDNSDIHNFHRYFTLDVYLLYPFFDVVEHHLLPCEPLLKLVSKMMEF